MGKLLFWVLWMAGFVVWVILSFGGSNNHSDDLFKTLVLSGIILIVTKDTQ